MDYKVLSHWYDSTWKKDRLRKRESNPGLPLSRGEALPLDQGGGNTIEEVVGDAILLVLRMHDRPDRNETDCPGIPC